jgi:DNA-binding PadR family transcriptional regulator
MPPAHSDRRLASGSPLRGALLALISEGEQPHGAYKLWSLVDRRLGPAWGVTRPSVYSALKGLEEDGLVSAVAKNRGGRGQTVYLATADAEPALAAWMEGPIGIRPVRVELQARIAMSSAKHAPQLLRALDVYERECFAMLRRTSEAEVPMGSWRGLAMNLTLSAVDEGLRAEFRWIAMARRWIGDFIAEASTKIVR